MSPPLAGDYEIDQTPAVAVVNRKKKAQKRRKEKQPKLSDPQLLAEALEHYKRRLHMLSAQSLNPHLRVEHVQWKGRTLTFASAYFKSERGPKAVLSVLWQTKAKPRWAVCVTFSLSVLDGPVELVAHCTCDHLDVQRKGKEKNCYHADVMFRNESFVNIVETNIRNREQLTDTADGTTLFGECIDIERRGHNWYFLTAFLDRTLQNRKNLVHRWMFFMVLDVNMQIFVPIVKEDYKVIQCMLCRTSSLRRGTCSHEDGCLAACARAESVPGMPSLLADVGLYNTDDGSDMDNDVEDDVDADLSDNGDESSIGYQENSPTANRSVRVREIYYPTTIKRPILPCPGEIKEMATLAKRLDKVPPGLLLSVDDRNKVSCHRCGNNNNKPRSLGFRRECTLFTVAQGTHRIYVYDWYCDFCQEKRKFTGKGSGIFPARKKSCYTTELLYLLAEMTCMVGISFRAAHKIVRLLSRTASIVRHKQASDEDQDGATTLRRRANDAFRAFIDHLDTNSTRFTNKLFSCHNCEVQVTKEDCAEIGITEEEGRGMKRLNAVVIDGTAAGILTKLPTFDRDRRLLDPASDGLGAKTLVAVPKHRKLLHKFFDIARKSLRQWKKRTTTYSSELSNETLNFWLYNPRKLKLPGAETPPYFLSNTESNIARLYISAESCFCTDVMPVSSGPHSDSCNKLRDYFSKKEKHVQIGAMLQQLFSVRKHVSNDEHAIESPLRGGSDAQDDEGYTTEGDIVSPTDGSDGRFGFYVTLLLPTPRQHPQFAESVISILQFTLLEHLSMPYVGRVSRKTEIIRTESSENSQTEGTNIQSSAPSAPTEGSNDTIQQSTGTPRDASNLRQDSTPSPERESTGILPLRDPETTLSMTSYTSVSFRLHVELFQAMEDYLSCMHFQEQGIPQNVPVECECVTCFKKTALLVNEANPILGSFCKELLKLKRPLHIIHSSAAASLLDLLKCHMQQAKNFFVRLEDKLGKNSKEYYADYGSVFYRTHAGGIQAEDDETSRGNETNERNKEGRGTQPETAVKQTEGTFPQSNSSQAPFDQGPSAESASQSVEEQQNALADTIRKKREENEAEELRQSKDSGVCFPGRRACRPCIIFNQEGQPNCSKKYNVSRSHTPGLLTIQCTCESPKLIGFIVMMQAESTALALFSVLTNFGIPPRTIYYDNACNLFVSTLIRVPWLLGRTRLAVDRFHYKSHKCSTYFDPDSYRQFDMERTEAAESINARIGKNLNTIRYLRGDYLIPFLRTRFSFLNLVGTFSQTYNRKDIEDEDMTAFLNDILKCECYRCKKLEDMVAQDDLEQQDQQGQQDNENEDNTKEEDNSFIAE